VCLKGDVGGVVVSDVFCECGDEHEGSVEQFVNSLFVGLDAGDAAFVEGVAGGGEQVDGLE